MENEYEIDNIKRMLEEKKYKVYNSNYNLDDIKKIQSLENLFNNDRCFFNIQFETAINILRFVGVPDNELINTYKKLTDPKLVSHSINFK